MSHNSEHDKSEGQNDKHDRQHDQSETGVSFMTVAQSPSRVVSPECSRNLRGLNNIAYLLDSSISDQDDNM